jgi:hypothetical protein
MLLRFETSYADRPFFEKKQLPTKLLEREYTQTQQK